MAWQPCFSDPSKYTYLFARPKNEICASILFFKLFQSLPGRDELGQRQQLSICKILILITLLYYISFLPFFIYQCLVYFLEFDINAPTFRCLKMFRNLGTLSDGLVFYAMSNRFAFRSFSDELTNFVRRTFSSVKPGSK